MDDLRASVDEDEGIFGIWMGFATNFEELYELGEEIGSGAWAKVHICTHKPSGEKRAVKVMEKWITKDKHVAPGFATRLRREVATYRVMSGSLNVCYFHGVYEDATHLYMITELCTGGQLWERVNAESYSEQQAARIIRQVLQLLAQAHSRNIIVRDIKPDNLLFLNHEESAPLKAIDFGIATFCGPDDILEERCGSPVYVAPEVLKKAYGQKADVWSAGMVAYLLLCGRLPWKGQDSITTSDLYIRMSDGKKFNRRDAFAALMFSEVDFESEPWTWLSKDAKDFVSRLLVKDPSKRVTAMEALQHRWVQPDDQGTAPNQPFDATIVQRLQKFGTFSNIKKVALRAIVASIAHDDRLLKDVRQAFEELEHGRGGSVPNATILQGLRDRGYTLEGNEAEQLVAHLDTDLNGMVDWYDWLAAMIDWHKVQEDQGWDAWVQDAFRALDVDGNGIICEQDLQQQANSSFASTGAEGSLDGDVSTQSSPAAKSSGTAMTFDEFSHFVKSQQARQDLSMYSRRLPSTQQPQAPEQQPQQPLSPASNGTASRSQPGEANSKDSDR